MPDPSPDARRQELANSCAAACSAACACPIAPPGWPPATRSQPARTPGAAGGMLDDERRAVRGLSGGPRPVHRLPGLRDGLPQRRAFRLLELARGRPSPACCRARTRLAGLRSGRLDRPPGCGSAAGWPPRRRPAPRLLGGLATAAGRAGCPQAGSPARFVPRARDDRALVRPGRAVRPRRLPPGDAAGAGAGPAKWPSSPDAPTGGCCPPRRAACASCWRRPAARSRAGGPGLLRGPGRPRGPAGSGAAGCAPQPRAFAAAAAEPLVVEAAGCGAELRSGRRPGSARPGRRGGPGRAPCRPWPAVPGRGRPRSLPRAAWPGHRGRAAGAAGPRARAPGRWSPMKPRSVAAAAGPGGCAIRSCRRSSVGARPRLLATGADLVVTTNPGCLGQIADALAAADGAGECRRTRLCR